MNSQKLERNIIAVLQEGQIKLGYESAKMKLYYPLVALNGLLGTDYDVDKMEQTLTGFCKTLEDRLGKIEISAAGERFCLTVPAEGADYIHGHMEHTEFLQEFIGAVRKHGCTIAEILSLFHRYSDRVHYEKLVDAEFDYLIYFEDGKPDDFRYCIQEEDCHLIYHRFTPEDYERVKP